MPTNRIIVPGNVKLSMQKWLSMIHKFQAIMHQCQYARTIA